MEKSLFEQMGGTYTQVGDYLLPSLILPEQQDQPIEVWGQRHARYLKQHHKIIYMNLLTSGKLNDVSAKYCYAAHESRLHQNDRCKRFALCLVLTVRFRSLAPWGKLFQLFI